MDRYTSPYNDVSESAYRKSVKSNALVYKKKAKPYAKRTKPFVKKAASSKKKKPFTKKKPCTCNH